MSWEIFKLREVATVIDSLHQTPKYSKTGIPMVRVTDVKGGYLSLDNTYKVSKDVFFEFSKNHKPQKGDIIITRVGTYGLSSFVNTNLDFCLGQNTAVIVPEINNKFLYYVMTSNIVTNQIEALITGSSYKSISLGHIRNLNISTPPLKTQKRIADILSAYDDLIENNLKRIKLLEQAAQNIYKEWFVNMRFPGYEEAKFDSETGLPEGWEIKELNSLIELLGGFAFKSKSYIDGGKYKVITIKNVGDRVFETSSVNHIDFIPPKLKKHCIIKEGDILLSLTGNVGRTCIAFGQNNLLNQRVAIIKPIKGHWRSYVYWLFTQRGIISMMNNLATGSAQQNLSPVKLVKEDVLVPPASIIEAYCEIAENHLNQIILLNKLNLRLKQARDILLPRLMNQTIEV